MSLIAATLSDGKREYLMAFFGRSEWYMNKNTVDIFIHDYTPYVDILPDFVI